MKKFLTATLLLFSIYANAQVQRLAILPTISSVTITRAEAAQFASYCVDYFRKTPEYNTQYNNIISREQTIIKVTKTNGSVATMTMEDGVRGNRPILKMNATGSEFYGGTFSEVTVSINPQRTDIRSVKVSPIRKSKIISETPDDITNLTSEVVFKNYGDDISQEELWKKSLLVEILKANNKLIVDNSGKLSSATLNLVSQLEIEPLLTKLEGQTFHNLIERGKIIIEENGLLTEETKKVLKDFQDVQEKILEYKLYSPDFIQASEHLSLEQIISKIQNDNNLEITGLPNPQLNEFLTNYGKPFEIVKDYELNGVNENVIAVTNSWYDNKYVIRIENKNYLFDKISKPSPLTSNHILDLETNFMADVKSYSTTNDDINYIYFSSIDNTAKELKTQIGSTEKKTKLNELSSFDEIIATIDDEIKNNSEKRNYVLSRDLFTKGKLGEYDKVNQSNLFGDKFIQGKSIGVEERTWINYTELLRELKAKYPEKNFFLGGNLYKDKYAITNMPKIKSGSDIAAYIAPKSLDLTFDQVNAMKSKLSSSGIMVHELDLDITNMPDNLLQANVLLLSGHKESAYEEFLKKLADKGLLRNKVVAVFSCNERGTANLNSYLIKKGYAKKVIFFPSKIDVTAINAVFSELAELTKNITIPEGVALDKLISEAIEKALNNPKYEDLQNEIKLFKEFINQTSFISFPNNQNLTNNG